MIMSALRDLPAIRHIKGTDAVVVDYDALIGNAVLLCQRGYTSMWSISSATMRFVMVVASVYSLSYRAASDGALETQR